MTLLVVIAVILILLVALAAIIWAQQAPSVTGTVQQYLLTPHGEVDGVLLQDGTVVRFPPHLGTALAGLAKPGDEVAVVGFLGPTTPHGRAIKALTITNEKTGQSVVDHPPSTPPLPPDMRGLAHKPLTVRGAVARLLVNDKGDVDGLILVGGEQVKFPPPNGPVVAKMLEEGKKTVEASGNGTTNTFGTVVDAMSLSMDGQAVPVSGPGRPRP
ncbi:MAG: hypothetical protein WCF59_06250 [Desulfobaccales bacterium]